MLLTAAIVVLVSCKKNNDANIIFKIKFDSTLPRLDNFGNPSTIPSGNSAQTPVFNSISAHYIEFAPDMYTPLAEGEIVYTGLQTTAGGSSAVDFSQAIIKGNDEVFLTVPISEVAEGTYEWVRVSLTYQNYDIDYLYSGTVYSGSLASFVGFNTYITDYTVGTENVPINANKLQGYWGFETFGTVYQGQAAGTTVPNPISSTSPIPPGSCVVTGSFPTPLTITGKEKDDIIITLNLSINQSFEWKDQNADGYYEPTAGDTVVDMGLRGLFPEY